MWPWSRIRDLEKALGILQRENRLLERRSAWLDREWIRLKYQLKMRETK
jgi:hypothetical protein